FGRLVAKGILAAFAQRLAPAVEDLAEGRLAGAVAEETVLVLQFDIEAVDIDGRQPAGAMAGDAGGGNEILSHFPCPCRNARGQRPWNPLVSWRSVAARRSQGEGGIAPNPSYLAVFRARLP